MEGAGSPVYWLGTKTRFASMLYQNGHLTFRWETSRDAMEKIWEGCILYPNEPIADLEEQKAITGFQLKNLIFNCRIVLQ